MRMLQEKNWHQLFELGIFLKGLNGIFEIISGTAILFITKTEINKLLFSLSRGELVEDPHDKVLQFVMHNLQSLSTSTQFFVGGYVLCHGLLNIFLAIYLYKEKYWAYLVALAAMSVFAFYQIYRISHSYSLTLTLITIWDIIFMVVIWHEYKRKTQSP